MYDALSCVKCIDVLAISDLALNKIVNKQHDERALTEMQRLRRLFRQETAEVCFL